MYSWFHYKLDIISQASDKISEKIQHLLQITIVITYIFSGLN